MQHLVCRENPNALYYMLNAKRYKRAYPGCYRGRHRVSPDLIDRTSDHRKQVVKDRADGVPEIFRGIYSIRSHPFRLRTLLVLLNKT